MAYKPLGQRIHRVLVTQGPAAAEEAARLAGTPDLFQRVRAVANEPPSPSFLHSALCAMSLPVRRPVDDQVPVIRHDGQYTLMITPKAVVDRAVGDQQLKIFGVPYGSLPRLILIHIMTEAVRSKSRHVILGSSFTDWMRRLGFRTISYGPRGSATLIRQQLDRLLACEWTIRWDNRHANGEKEFGIKEIKLTDEYIGIDRPNGTYVREIYLTEAFDEHLRKHAVPLNEHAIKQIRDSATALDLYTWLAYRLPRANPNRPATLSWQQMAVHFGNDGRNIRKFRQTIRDAWERHVSAVYPEARADFDTRVIRLYASPAPMQQQLAPGSHLMLVAPAGATEPTDDTGAAVAPAEARTVSERFNAAIRVMVPPGAFKAWFADSRLEEIGGRWCLIVRTRFMADWIRSNFESVIERAAGLAGMDKAPAVQTRPASR